jgi:hypothetical protein
MTVDIAKVFAGLVPIGISAWLGFFFAGRQSRKQEKRATGCFQRRTWLSRYETCAPSCRKHGRVDIQNGEVASAFQSWFEAVDRHQHRLPSEWRHVSRSVRAAAGIVLGPVSFVDIRPETAREPLEDPDILWQDFADDYLGYVLDRIMRWGGSIESGRSELLQFDPWLVRTGRRMTIGMNRQPWRQLTAGRPDGHATDLPVPLAAV